MDEEICPQIFANASPFQNGPGSMSARPVVHQRARRQTGPWPTDRDACDVKASFCYTGQLKS